MRLIALFYRSLKPQREAKARADKQKSILFVDRSIYGCDVDGDVIVNADRKTELGLHGRMWVRLAYCINKCFPSRGESL